MGFADYLTSLNLDPAAAERLNGMVGTPPPPVGAQLNQQGNPQAAPFSGTGPMEPAPVAPDNSLDAADMVAGSPEFLGQTPEQVRSAAGAGFAGAKATGSTAPAPAPEEEAPSPPQEDRGSPGHFVGAQWVPGSRSRAVSEGFKPEEFDKSEGRRDAGEGHGIMAAEKRLEAAQQDAEADAVYAAAHAEATRQQIAQAAKIDNERAAYVNQERQKLEVLSQAAQQKVDPDAAQGPAGAQLLAAIAIGLGQFGAGLTGGPNAALQIVTANIDRRIAAQRDNIANAGRSHDREMGLYKDNLAEFGDRERAAAATKVMMLDQAKAMADQQYAVSKKTANEGAYHDMIKGLNDERAKAALEIEKLSHDQVQTTGNEHFVPGHVVGAGGPSKDLPNVLTLPGKGKDGLPTQVQLPNEVQFNKAAEKFEVITKLQRMNQQALELRKQIADKFPGTKDYRSIHKALEDMEADKINLLSTAAGQGVVKESEYARSMAKQAFLTEGVGWDKDMPFSSIKREAADENILRQIKRGDQELENIAKAPGARIVKSGYVRDASGNLVPVREYTGKDVSPDERLAPKGSKPLKKGLAYPTADDALGDRTDSAPRFGETTTSGGSGGKGNSAHVKRRK